MESSPDPRGADCFPVTTDPRDYLPRPSTERALRAMRVAIAGRRHAILLGAPGVGKTLLLRQLGRQLKRDGHHAYLAYTRLSQSEICAAALHELGLPASKHPETDLLATAAQCREDGGALLLLLDDAGALPLETAVGIVALAAVSHGSLRLALAANDEPAGADLLEVLGPESEIVHLSPMDLAETARYLRMRVARALGPAAARSVDSHTISVLYRASRGSPRELHQTLHQLALTHAVSPGR